MAILTATTSYPTKGRGSNLTDAELSTNHYHNHREFDMENVEFVYEDLNIKVERVLAEDGEQKVRVSYNMPFHWQGREETEVVTEDFRTDKGQIRDVMTGYCIIPPTLSYTEAVELTAEIHDLDLWDNIDNMRLELGELADTAI